MVTSSPTGQGEQRLDRVGHDERINSLTGNCQTSRRDVFVERIDALLWRSRDVTGLVDKLCEAVPLLAAWHADHLRGVVSQQ